MSKRVIRAKTGTELECKGWLQEAALRMLCNNLDPNVAENPAELVVYGGRGRAARNWEAFDNIVAALKTLNDDESLLVQSGKPVGVIKSHPDAPRVLIANSNLVGNWANWEHFDELEKKGLMMYGQMTAGSWIYIGTQGIVQGTYETFAQAARTHFGTDGDLTGKVVLTGGLGGMGGAQPLAVTMCNGVCLAVEVDEHRLDRRLETRYLDKKTSDLAQAMAWVKEAKEKGVPLSVGLLGNAAEVFPKLRDMGFMPDLITDQTSAHDPLYGYVPLDTSLSSYAQKREQNKEALLAEVRASMARQVDAMLAWLDDVPVFDYGNNLRAEAKAGGCTRLRLPRFRSGYFHFLRRHGPFRWVALSGDLADIKATDDCLRELFHKNFFKLARHGPRKDRVPRPPARICWVMGNASKRAWPSTIWSRREKSSPHRHGRDHLDSGSVASPNRETEAMKDGSDAVADWPLLNLMSNAVNGATWVSFHHGGVGMGYSLHSGVVVVADGTEAAAPCGTGTDPDPALGVMRHADAGYDRAIDVARERDVMIPGLTYAKDA